MKKYKFRVEERATSLGKPEYYAQVEIDNTWKYLAYYQALKSIEIFETIIHPEETLEDAKKVIQIFKDEYKENINPRYHEVN